MAKLLSQPMGDLQVMPRNLNFMNNYDRSKIVHVKNISMNTVTIDSINFNAEIYSIRLNGHQGFPISISADSEFSFEVVQYNYFNLTASDSSSIITIFNNGGEPEISIGAHHHYFYQVGQLGNVTGTVSDSVGILGDASVYFFYDENLLIDSAVTNSNGNFSIDVPRGDYFVSAKKDGYYMQFAYGKDSPLGADVITVKHNESTNLDFILEKEIETNIDVGGTVTDTENATLKKTIVVIRKGTHTPTKISSGSTDDLNRSYSVLTNESGVYKLNNLKYSGDYYVQAFAPLNIPGYYTVDNKPAIYWQDADSISVSNSLSNIDIVVARDSSYGAGVVEGTVLSNNSNSTINDALIYVQSANDSKIYSYNLVSSEGKFSIPVLPYGQYKIIAQKIGLQNTISEPFDITIAKDTVTGIDLIMIVTSVDNPDIQLDFNLQQNYPNPFNPSTNIEFSLNDATDVKLIIYNVLGEKISTLLNNNLQRGNYTIKFNAGDLPSGIYFYELRTNDNRLVKKMNLLR